MSKVHSLWTNFKTLILPSSIFSSGILSYFYLNAEGNQKKWLLKFNDIFIKDTARLIDEDNVINRADPLVN